MEENKKASQVIGATSEGNANLCLTFETKNLKELQLLCCLANKQSKDLLTTFEKIANFQVKVNLLKT